MNSTHALPSIRNVVYTDNKITELAHEISEKASSLKLNLLLIGPDAQTHALPMDTISSMTKAIWVCQSLPEVFRHRYHEQADLFVLLGELPHASAMDFKKLLKPPLLSAVVVKLTCGGCGGTGADPIFPPRGPLTMKYLRIKLFYVKILYD